MYSYAIRMESMAFRVIKPEKIKKARGDRSLQDIADAAGGRFTRGALWQWEQENGTKPTDENIPRLLEALGCSYEDISEPVELQAA